MTRFRDLSPAVLRTLLRLDPRTGRLYWRDRSDRPGWWNRKYAGKEITKEYVSIRYGKRQYGPPRKTVIWAMVCGKWPKESLREIDGELGEVTSSAVHHGQEPRGRVQFKGVSYHQRDRRYASRIKVDGKLRHLGHYSTAVAAAARYDTEARKAFGEMAVTNADRAETALERALLRLLG